jgi:hypothetical protein
VPRPYRKFHDQTQEPDSARRYDAAELLIEYCQTTDLDDCRVLPPCGRGLGPCEAVIETDAAGTRLHCLTCDCVAPYPLKAKKDVV